MAFGAGVAIGSGGSATANQVTITATLTAQAPANSLVVIAFALDNFATVDGDEGAISSVSDSAGNAWQKAIEFCNGQGASQAGATVSIWYCHNTNAIPNAGSVVANLTNSSARDATAWSGRAFTKGADTTIVVDKIGSLANDGAGLGALNVTGTVNTECLRIRGIASESNSTTVLTPTGSWTALTGNRSGSGSAAANITVRGEFRISTGTSDNSAPTYVSADHASAYVAFREARRLVAGQGAYALVGFETVPLIGRFRFSVADAPVASFPVGGATLVDPVAPPLLVAAPGEYLVSGQAVALRSTSFFAVDVGTYALAGQDAGLSRSFRIVAAQGAYGIAGQAAGVRSGRAFAANFGPYALTGQAAVLRRSFTLAAGSGLYVANGQAAALFPAGAVTSSDRLTVSDAAVAAFSVAGSNLVDPAVSAAVMPADRGLYSLVGQAAALNPGQVISVETGSYAVVGGEVSRALTVSVGNYNYVGQPAALNRNTARTLMALRGLFSLVGQSVELTKVGAGGLPVVDHLAVGDAAVASFAVAGSRIGDRYEIAAERGNYVYDGSGAATRAARRLQANVGSFILAGQPATLVKHIFPAMPAAQGAYALAGQAAGLRTARRITAAFGPYLLTGQAAALHIVQATAAARGVYTLTGQVAGLRRAFRLAANVGTYVLAGQQAGKRRTYLTSAVFGPYAVNGQPVLMFGAAAKAIAANFGTYGLAGQAVALRATRRVVVAQGAYAYTGQGSALRITLPVSVSSYALAGQAVALGKGYRLIAAVGPYGSAGYAVSLLAIRRLVAGQGAYALVGQAAGLKRSFELTAAFGAYQFTGQALAAVNREYMLTADTGFYGVTGFNIFQRRRATILRTAGVSSQTYRQARPPAVATRRR